MMSPATSSLLSVVALPVLAPLAAILQLLFPGLMLTHWRQYKIAILVLLTQSTVWFTHWTLINWFLPNNTWWLNPDYLFVALVLVAIIGMLFCIYRFIRNRTDQEFVPQQKPAKIEFILMGLLSLGGLTWGIYQWTQDRSLLTDPLTMVTVASWMGWFHLFYRKFRVANNKPAYLSTQVSFLSGLACTGIVLTIFYFQPTPSNRQADLQTAEQPYWPTFQQNEKRTGSIDPYDPGPASPTILWKFDPKTIFKKADNITIHSTPLVYQGYVYIAVSQEIFGQLRGYLICINAEPNREGFILGEHVWHYPGENDSFENAMHPIASSPVLMENNILIGEGYHYDPACQLFCFDAVYGEKLWTLQTKSHVESTASVQGERIFIGAGDDGLYCLQQPQTDADQSTVISLKQPNPDNKPKVLWQYEGVHIDSSPLVVGDRVYVGTMKGDIYQGYFAIAIDIETGKTIWRIPSEIPVCTAPSYTNGRVFFGLGEGRIIGDMTKSAKGGVWCLDAKSGRRIWKFDQVKDSVFTAPVLWNPDGQTLPVCSSTIGLAAGGNPYGPLSAISLVLANQVNRLYICSRDGYLYCLQQEDGRLLWKKDLKDLTAATPVVAGGKVYIINMSGTLFCFDARNGQMLWQFDKLVGYGLSRDVIANPVLIRGRLYLAVGGVLFCIGDR